MTDLNLIFEIFSLKPHNLGISIGVSTDWLLTDLVI